MTVRFNEAVRIGDHNEVRNLIEKNLIDPSERNNWAIKHAVENGYFLVVKELLKDPRVDPSVENNWAIRKASMNGLISIVKLLLNDPRVDPSDLDNDAIHLAWMSGYYGNEVVKLLLSDPRVDPSSDNNYAIEMASEYGYNSVVELLLSDRRTILDDDIVKKLLSNSSSEVVEAYFLIEDLFNRGNSIVDINLINTLPEYLLISEFVDNFYKGKLDYNNLKKMKRYHSDFVIEYVCKFIPVEAEDRAEYIEDILRFTLDDQTITINYCPEDTEGSWLYPAERSYNPHETKLQTVLNSGGKTAVKNLKEGLEMLNYNKM